MNAHIIGTGSFLPEKVITNFDLAERMETSDEWIVSRTGIRQRHIAVEESTAGMAAEAAQRALTDAGMQAGELEMILLATVSPDHIVPSAACEVQAMLGAVNAVAIELNAACSGFVFALNTAQAYIRAGIYTKILVVGVETLSKLVDWTDRSTCILFGDGAGAAVVTASENRGIMDFIQFSDGAKGEALLCDARPLHNLFVRQELKQEYVKMDGQEVFKFAVRRVSESIDQLLERNGLSSGEIDCYILHQANARIIASVIKHLKADADKFPTNVERCGNTSGASVPLLLDELNRAGHLKEGDRVIMSGFGGGLTWGSIYMVW
ncbi:MAG: ketoacyl-ACP synthase III [Lachnospiraceae bacterium]|nr:ketoacyl-ACP synthase III [Lachnospiraceae bacterium]